MPLHKTFWSLLNKTFGRSYIRRLVRLRIKSTAERPKVLSTRLRRAFGLMVVLTIIRPGRLRRTPLQRSQIEISIQSLKEEEYK